MCIRDRVNEIASVDGRAEPTSQMREYAARTHQHGMPELARNYQPATIDLAAMPVRVEKWRVGGKVQYLSLIHIYAISFTHLLHAHPYQPGRTRRTGAP